MRKKKLCLTVNLNKSDSFPASPTAAQATAIDCGEIIFPTPPPEEFAASANKGSIPMEVAVTFCRPPNRRFADVSDPVINTPSQPRKGEKNGKKVEPVFANVIPNAIHIPEAFVTNAKATTDAIVKIGYFNSSSVSPNVTIQFFQEMPIMNLEIMAESKIAVPAEPRSSSL